MIDLLDPAEFHQRPAQANKSIHQVRTQPDRLEIRLDGLKMLPQAFTDLCQAKPRLERVGTDRRKRPEQSLRLGMVALGSKQLSKPVQRVGVFWLSIQDPPVATFGLRRL